jgi:preprotein translocase subunit SecA
MDYLREGVHLRSMAQKDPLVEYTSEGERMFTDLGRSIRAEVVLHLFHAELAPQDVQQELAPAAPPAGNGNVRYEHQTSAGAEVIDAALGAGASTAAVAAAAPTAVQAGPHDKIGRNDPCWCGSGKKFKKCHGA